MSENRETCRRAPIFVSMDLDHDACYRALEPATPASTAASSPRVKTTGIYCRPVCPARTPKRGKVVFYPTAAAAQEAGFRPCLRCRPETAPDLGAWRGASNTVRRALVLIEAGAARRGRPSTPWPAVSASANANCAGCSASTWAPRPLPSPRRAGCCSPSS